MDAADGLHEGEMALQQVGPTFIVRFSERLRSAGVKATTRSHQAEHFALFLAVRCRTRSQEAKRIRPSKPGA